MICIYAEMLVWISELISENCRAISDAYLTRIKFPKQINIWQISFLHCYDCKPCQALHTNASYFFCLYSFKVGVVGTFGHGLEIPIIEGSYIYIPKCCNQSENRSQAECERLLLLIVAWYINTIIPVECHKKYFQLNDIMKDRYIYHNPFHS